MTLNPLLLDWDITIPDRTPFHRVSNEHSHVIMGVHGVYSLDEDIVRPHFIDDFSQRHADYQLSLLHHPGIAKPTEGLFDSIGIVLGNLVKLFKVLGERFIRLRLKTEAPSRGIETAYPYFCIKISG